MIGFAYGAAVTAAFALGTVGGTVAGVLLVAGGIALTAYGAMQAIDKYRSGQWTDEDSAALAGDLVGGITGGSVGSRAASRYMNTLHMPCQSPYTPGRALNAGMIVDRNGFTKAGRALQKHGSRPGSVFPKAPNKAVEANKMGQAILESIILSQNQLVKSSKSGNVHIFDRPTGRGASYGPDGSLAGFVERVPEP